jgi:hypothetical protein
MQSTAKDVPLFDARGPKPQQQYIGVTGTDTLTALGNSTEICETEGRDKS